MFYPHQPHHKTLKPLHRKEFVKLTASPLKGEDIGYYHTCQYCGANLDPGERCDCMKLRERHPPYSI